MRKWIYVIIATASVIIIYLGWTYYSRWSEQREYIRKFEEAEAAKKKAVADAYGEGLTIRQFSASSLLIEKGETAQLCYSVSNSKSVRIEPFVEELWPAFHRCIDVTPKKDTTYTFTAEDDKGNKKTQSLTIKVK
jgi:hypothetical protein